MDGITLIQTVVPLIIAVIFTSISVADIKEMFMEKTKMSLTPLWCMVAGLSWIFYSIVSIYGTTTDYLSALSYLYLGLGLLFFPVLFFAAILQNITLTGKQRDADEMRIN